MSCKHEGGYDGCLECMPDIPQANPESECQNCKEIAKLKHDDLELYVKTLAEKDEKIKELNEELADARQYGFNKYNKLSALKASIAKVVEELEERKIDYKSKQGKGDAYATVHYEIRLMELQEAIDKLKEITN